MTQKFIPPGKHAAIVGQNGSGKSQQLINLVRNNPQRVVVLDTKLDDDFLYIARRDEVLIVANSYKDMIAAINDGEFDVLIVRPENHELASHEALDNYLKALSQCRNLSIFIDEAYQFHNSGRALSGYVSILTRGRSRKLSLIVCTQRPSWVSTFTFSEAKYFFIYHLNMSQDHKKLREYIDLPDFDKLGKFQYFFYCTDSKNVLRCEPVELFTREKVIQDRKKYRNLFKTLLGGKK